MAISWGETAARITNPISLAAYGIAAVVCIVIRSRKARIPNAVWLVIACLVLVPNLAPPIVEVLRFSAHPTYRVRVTVLDPSGVPIDENNTRVWSSLGGETKTVSGGWEIDVTNDSKPVDGKLTVFAQVASAFLNGRETVVLADDHSPALILTLRQDDTAKIAGTVFDESRQPARNATVYVVGYQSEGMATNGSGYFELKAHKSEGQQVELHAEAHGKAADAYRPAGRELVELWLH
jgi:hypothetical protein